MSAIRKIVAEQLEMGVADVTAHHGLNRHPRWDSFGHIAILTAIESERGIRFSDELITQLTTVALLEDYLGARHE